VRHTDFDKVLKTAFLLTTAILVIGSSAAIEWESPGAGEVIPGDQTLNFTDDSSGEASMWYRADDGWEDIFINASNSGTSTFYWAETSPSFGDAGSVNDLELKANTTSDEETITVTLDQGGPDVSLQDSDLEFVGDDPTITVTADDDYSNIDSLTASAAFTEVLAEDERDCSSGKKCIKEFDLETNSLSSGNIIDLTLEATDQVGNPDSSNPSLTFDNSFEADTPEFSVEENEDGVVALDGEVNVDVTVDNIDEETSDQVKVKCLIDSDELNSEWYDSDDSDYSCELSEDEVEDETVEVSVEVCDQAGNCEKSDEEEITFDGSDPVMESFSTVQEYKVFGDDFNVEYDASDSATDIANVEYFFSTAALPGEGNEADVEDQEFKVETSLLSEDSNQHTVYMRVQDEAGRWSDYSSVDFEYYPNANPSVSLSVPENFSMTAGQSRGFDAVAENTGKLMIGSVNVSFSSDLFEGDKTVEDLEGDESRNVEFVLEPKRSQIGEWSVEVSTSGPVDSASTTVLVEANSEQRNTVDEKIENYSALLEDLKSNVSSLKKDGLNEELEESMNSGVSSFRETVESAQEYVDQKNYYRAFTTLENVENQYSEASQTFEQVSEKHKINERNSMIMMVLAGLALILVAGGAFVYTRDDYDLVEQLEAGEYELPEIGGVKEALSEKFSDLKSFLKSEEEQVEDAFEGFK
jgi:hypothetical protein